MFQFCSSSFAQAFKLSGNHSQTIAFGMSELFVIMFLLTALTIPIVLIATSRMREFQSRNLAITGSVLIMLPVSLIAIPGLFIGIWSLSVLMRDDVRKAFAAKTASIDTTRVQIQKAGRWLTIAGSLAILLPVGIIVYAFFQPMMYEGHGALKDDFITAFIFSVFATSLFPALQIYSGIKMKNRTSIRWSYLAAILGLIPYSPAWLISLPSSIYAFAVLGQRTDGVKSNSELFGRPLKIEKT